MPIFFIIYNKICIFLIGSRITHIFYFYFKQVIISISRIFIFRYSNRHSIYISQYLFFIFRIFSDNSPFINSNNTAPASIYNCILYPNFYTISLFVNNNFLIIHKSFYFFYFFKTWQNRILFIKSPKSYERHYCNIIFSTNNF